MKLSKLFDNTQINCLKGLITRLFTLNTPWYFIHNKVVLYYPIDRFWGVGVGGDVTSIYYNFRKKENSNYKNGKENNNSTLITLDPKVFIGIIKNFL